MCKNETSSVKSLLYYEVVLQIPDGEVLEGTLPPGKLKIVQAWMEIHQDDLIADWKLASTGENVFKIDPLK
jgi:hypothetical protein